MPKTRMTKKKKKDNEAEGEGKPPTKRSKKNQATSVKAKHDTPRRSHGRPKLRDSVDPPVRTSPRRGGKAHNQVNTKQDAKDGKAYLRKRTPTGSEFNDDDELDDADDAEDVAQVDANDDAQVDADDAEDDAEVDAKDDASAVEEDAKDDAHNNAEAEDAQDDDPNIEGMDHKDKDLHAANINAHPYANAKNSQAANNSDATANVTAKADAAADVVSKVVATNATTNPDAAANVVSKAVDTEVSTITNCNAKENDGQEDAVAIPAKPTSPADVESNSVKDHHANNDDAGNDNSSTAARLAEPTDNRALPGDGAELPGDTENWENHTSQSNTEASENNTRRSKRLSQKTEGSQVVDSTEAASFPPTPPGVARARPSPPGAARPFPPMQSMVQVPQTNPQLTMKRTWKYSPTHPPSNSNFALRPSPKSSKKSHLPNKIN